MIGEFVLVRTYSAGVRTGILLEISGTQVVLAESRRIFRWSGAFTCDELSQHGCDESSRIGEVVPRVLVTQAIEVFPCSEKARENLSRSRNGSPSNSD